MKIKHFLPNLLAAALLLASGCVSEEPAYRQTPGTEPEETDACGWLALESSALRVIVDSETEIWGDQADGEPTRAGLESDFDSYLVRLVREKGALEEVVRETTYGELCREIASSEQERLPLPVGTYRLEVRSESEADEPLVAWEHPVYGTVVDDILIAKDQSTVLDEIVCRLQNIKVSFGYYSADLAAKLSDDTCLNASLNGSEQAVAVFSKTETRAAYFRATEAVNTLRLSMSGSFVGAENKPVTFNKVLTGVKAGQWRRLTIVMTYAEQGDLRLDVEVDSFILDEEITVDGTASLWEPVLDDEKDPSAPSIVWEGRDLEQEFLLTPSMFDAEGNCTVPVELDVFSPNGIESALVRIESTSADFLSSLKEVLQLDDPSFDLCRIGAGDVTGVILRGFGFPVGDEILGRTSRTISVTSMMAQLNLFEGLHTFAFTVVDANGLSCDAALKIRAGGQQPPAGDDPTIVWEREGVNIIRQQHDLVEGLQIELLVSAPRRIEKFEVTIDSEVLAPYLSDPDINIPQQFDLCNVDEVLAGKLKGFNFPVGDEVRGCESLTFSLTDFVPLMMVCGTGTFDFILRITDRENGVAEETVRLIYR